MLNFGGFLSSNFWTNYRCQSSASIEDLLSSKDCTVDKLLDDDDCLQEFKNYNDKLIKYFEHDKLKTLIDYITVLPEKDEQNRGHKYPFIAGEIFNCEINQILDKFFESPPKHKPQPIAPAEDAKDEEKKDEDSEGEASEKKEETKAATETEEGAADEAPKDEAADADADADTEKVEDEADKPVEEETKADVEPEAPKDEETEKETPVVETPAADPKNTQEPESEEIDKENEEVVKAADPKEAKAEPEEEEVSEKVETAEETKVEETETDDKKEATPPVETSELTTNASMSTLQTEIEAEDEVEENKYVLLERLFNFISTEEELNPVLSGYFCKLVSLLISRKQKQLFPFIFSKESTVIEDLLKHVYQKSISEILNKLLTLNDTEHEPEILEMIQQKQQMAVSVLITSLGPEKNEEHNLNACAIIQDMFEIKEFYSIICQKENLQTIVDFSLAGMNESTKDSKCSSLQVLNQIILNHIERQKKIDQKVDADKNNHDEDDDIVQQNSDDEAADDQQDSAAPQTAILIEVLKEKIGAIETILLNNHEIAQIKSSVTDEEYVPLGQQRLYTIELVLRMVQLKKEALDTVIGESKIFFNIMELVKQYPWNNFMQLKVINISDEILDNSESEALKKMFLNGSGIAKALIDMAADASYKMNTGRQIRNGYMALVVSISNKLIKKFKGTGQAGTEDATVVEYLDNVGEEWRAFVDDELANSNANNNKTLGGSTKLDDGENSGGDHDDPNYDDQMEKIMQRFTNFNQILSQGSADTEENDDSDENDDTIEGDEEVDTGSASTTETMKIEKVQLKPEEPLAKEFIDHAYWEVGQPTPGEEIDYDSLLAELEA